MSMRASLIGLVALVTPLAPGQSAPPSILIAIQARQMGTPT